MTLVRPTPYTMAQQAIAAISAEWSAQGETRALDFGDGSMLLVLVKADAMLGESVLATVLAKFRASFINTAEGDDLDTIIMDYSGIVRLPATASTATITITRGAYVGSYTAHAGDEVRGFNASGDPVVFTVQHDTTMSGSASSVNVSTTCSATGRAGNVAAGTLTTYVGLPSGLTVSQPDRAAGGADKESDDAYRQRYRLSIASLSAAGTPEWIELRALSVPGVTFVTIDESTIHESAGGYVGIFIGDPDAGASSELIASVQAAFDSTTGHVGGIEYIVFGCEREELAFTINAKIVRGSPITQSTLKADFIAYLDNAAVAKRVYLSAAEGFVHDRENANGLLSVDISGPGGAHEVAPSAAYKAIRTAADGSQLTVNITEV